MSALHTDALPSWNLQLFPRIPFLYDRAVDHASNHAGNHFLPIHQLIFNSKTSPHDSSNPCRGSHTSADTPIPILLMDGPLVTIGPSRGPSNLWARFAQLSKISGVSAGFRGCLRAPVVVARQRMGSFVNRPGR